MTPTLQQIQQMSMEASVATTKLGKLSNNYGKLLPDLKKINYYHRLQKDLQSTVQKVEKQALPDLKKLVKTNSETIKATKKIAEQGKKLADLFKKGLFKEINPKFGAWMNIGTTLLSLGFTTLLIKKNEEIQEIELRTADVRDAEFDKLWQRSLRNSSQVKNLTTKVNTIEKDYKTSTDKIYAEAAGAAKNAAVAREKANDALYEVRANKPKLEAQIAEAKKQGNDALYETRQGRVKLETQIAEAKKQSNDALYETRAGRTKLESQIAEAKKQSNDALYETRAGRTKLESQIAEANKKSNDALYETRTERTKLETQISNLQLQVKQFTSRTSSEFEKTLQTTINNVVKDLNVNKSRLDKQEQKTSFIEKTLGAVQGAVKTLQDELTANKRAITDAKKDQELQTIKLVGGITKEYLTSYDDTVQGLKDKQVASVQLLADLRQQQNSTFDRINQKFKEVADAIPNAFKEATGKIDNEFAKIQQKFEKVENNIEVVKQGKTDTTLEPKILDLQSQVNQQKAELNQTRTNLKDLDTKIKEQEKVNQAAIPKLDQILGFLPLIPARAAAAIRPNIPTIPQIEQASATGTCRTLQPGGCSRKAFDDLGNGINQNINNQSNNLFDKLNAGANAGQLILLKIIDNKLGAQITGGISGKLVDGFKWLHLDRVLGILTFAATVQNHLMLSRDIGTTLLGAFTNVLTLIGLKDDKGDTFDIGSVINSTIENFVKGVVGAENYAILSETWAKANRIYQATTNVLNAFQGLSSTILSGMELIAGNNAKIGNALRKAGMVLETAYGWMNPQPKFNRVTQTLEKLQSGASTIQMVTQAPLDVINATTELQNANTELIKALKEDNKPENKAPEIPEPDGLKAKETESKTTSQPLTFNFSDLFDGED